MSTMPVGTFVNVQEAAKLVGCTEGRIRQMLLDGTLKGEKANQRAWLILTTEIERLREKPYTTGRPRTSGGKKQDRT